MHLDTSLDRYSPPEQGRRVAVGELEPGGRRGARAAGRAQVYSTQGVEATNACKEKKEPIGPRPSKTSPLYSLRGAYTDAPLTRALNE